MILSFSAFAARVVRFDAHVRGIGGCRGFVRHDALVSDTSICWVGRVRARWMNSSVEQCYRVTQ